MYINTPTALALDVSFKCFKTTPAIVCSLHMGNVERGATTSMIAVNIKRHDMCNIYEMKYELRSSYLPFYFAVVRIFYALPLPLWHYERNGVSNHRHLDYLLHRLFGRRAKITSKLNFTCLCEVNSLVTGEYPHKGPVTRKMIPFGDVIKARGHVSPRRWQALRPWFKATFLGSRLCYPVITSFFWSRNMRHNTILYEILTKLLPSLNVLG